ncbi:MAG TPA: helix-turn-helix transcriptional regulator [Faecalibacter sp.]
MIHIKIKFLIFKSFLFLLSYYSYANTINFNQLNQEITQSNASKNYQQSIQRLNQILNDPNANAYDKYAAHLLKYVTYKTLFNYPEAEINLKKAEEFGLKSKELNEVQTRIAIEKVFLKFDLLQYNEARQLITSIAEQDLKYVDFETQGFYYSVLGTFQLIDQNYKQAEAYYDKGIRILELGAPEHLANLYRAKMRLYEETNNHEAVIKAFNDGIAYAHKYKMDVYVLNLYEQLTTYYASIEDYKSAYQNRIIVNELASKYDALNQSGKLLILEKNMMQEQNQLEIKNEQNIRLFLIILTVILIALLLVLYQLFKINKYKRKFVELENSEMRAELKSLNLMLNKTGENALDLNQFNLSERQKQIIRLVEQGKTNKEIGAALFISENTVKYHLKIIYNTLGISNRNSLIKE